MRRLFLVLSVGVLVAGPAYAQPSAPRILVVPFDGTSAEPRLRWLGEASAVLLTDELNARGLGAITRPERLRAYDKLHLPPYAILSRATVIKIGEIVGASEVLVGSFAVTDDLLSVDVHSLRIDVGRLEPEVKERGPLDSIFAVFERMASRLAPDSTAGPRESRPPLGAFENYIKGLVADSPAAQVGFLETAIRLHPRYDRAELALWEVRSGQDQDLSALAAARAVPDASRLGRRARFLAGVSLLDLGRYDEAFEAFTGLLADLPAAPAGSRSGAAAALYNNLGIVQIRRGGVTPQSGTPAYFLTKGADADPGDPDLLFNLGYAYVLEHDTAGAIYWLREALRRNPADADAHFVLAGALQAAGNTVEAARERELAGQLSSHYEELDKRPSSDRTSVPHGLERVRTDMESIGAPGPEMSIVNSAQREQRELTAFHLERGRRLFEREEDRQAMAELRRAVYLSPYEAEAHLLIGRIYLRGGRPAEAVDALKISIWSQDTAPAHVALAEAYLKEGKTPAARTELERALALDPQSDTARRLLATLK